MTLRPPSSAPAPTEGLRDTRWERDGLSFRPLQEGDGKDLQDFAQELGAGSRDMFAPYRWEDADLPDQFRAAIERSRRGADDLHLAFLSSRPVALLVLWSIGRCLDSPVGPLRIPTLGLAVGDRFQGRGIGARSLEFLVERATNLGAAGIELTAAPANLRAKHLYAQAGFQRIGTLTIPLGVNPADGSMPSGAGTRWREEEHMYRPIDGRRTDAAVAALRRRIALPVH